MAVPKRKKSTARRDTRRANHNRPPKLTLVACSRCGEPKLSHRVCMTCGTYGSVDVLHIEKE